MNFVHGLRHEINLIIFDISSQSNISDLCGFNLQKEYSQAKMVKLDVRERGAKSWELRSRKYYLSFQTIVWQIFKKRKHWNMRSVTAWKYEYSTKQNEAHLCKSNPILILFFALVQFFLSQTICAVERLQVFYSMLVMSKFESNLEEICGFNVNLPRIIHHSVPGWLRALACFNSRFSNWIKWVQCYEIFVTTNWSFQ